MKVQPIHLIWIALIFNLGASHYREAKAQYANGELDHGNILVVGFVGGIKRHNDMHEGPVQIGERLKGIECNGMQVRVYSNWHWRRAYSWVYQTFDQDQNGQLSQA